MGDGHGNPGWRSRSWTRWHQERPHLQDEPFGRSGEGLLASWATSLASCPRTAVQQASHPVRVLSH